MARTKGWRLEPARHSLAQKGIKTKGLSPSIAVGGIGSNRLYKVVPVNNEFIYYSFLDSHGWPFVFAQIDGKEHLVAWIVRMEDGYKLYMNRDIVPSKIPNNLARGMVANATPPWVSSLSKSPRLISSSGSDLAYNLELEELFGGVPKTKKRMQIAGRAAGEKKVI
jgi:hypothetical protein